jgi:hypothetical protein
MHQVNGSFFKLSSSQELWPISDGIALIYSCSNIQAIISLASNDTTV